MIDINSLKSTMEKISRVGPQELEFDMNGQKVVFRHLSDEEEVVVFNYSQESLREGQADNFIHEMFHRFKVCTLSYAIIQIGEHDLRGVKFLETGEVLKNGVSVKRPKEEVLRDLLESWSRPLLNKGFMKYGELIEKVEIAAEHIIQFEPSNLDTEIQRLENRIEELKNMRQKHKEREIDEKGLFIKEMIEAEKISSDEIQDIRKKRSEEAFSSEQVSEEEPVQTRQESPPEPVAIPVPEPVVERKFQQEERTRPPFVKASQSGEAKQILPPPKRRPVPGPPPEPELVPSSLTQEVVQQRRKAALEEMKKDNIPTRYSGVNPVPSTPVSRKPPHLAAKQTAEEIEVFEVPTQIVGGTMRGGTKKNLEQSDLSNMNPRTSGAQNPNWVPPKR